MAETMPANISGNCQAAVALPAARGVASAVNRDAPAVVDRGRS
jgi:hypothetical protein